MKYLTSIADAVVDRSPETLIGALLVATAIALVMAGLYALRRRKAPCSPTFVGLLAFASGVSCMALGAGYIEYKAQEMKSVPKGTPPVFAGWPGPPPQNPPQGPWGLYGAGWSSGFHTVVAADENRDGRLTLEELTLLIRRADTDGDGSVDSRDIDRVIMYRTRRASQPSDRSAPNGTEGKEGNGSSSDQGENGEGHSPDEKPAP
jgi:hypothetical protein